MGDEVPRWLSLQKKIFTRYVEQRLQVVGKKVKINDIAEDISDGTLLIDLVCALSGAEFTGKPLKSATVRIQKIDNVNTALSFAKAQGIKFTASAEDIIDGNQKLILSAIFAIILKYIKLDEDDADSGDIKEALLIWLKNKTQGYDGVNPENFSKSFHDGLLFSALIHKFRPRMLDFSKLSADNKIDNLKAAFAAAEKSFSLEQYLTADDIAHLDELGGLIFAYDWYMGVTLMQKQDIAARRIGKLADMTKLHDEMRAEYIARSKSLVSWTEEKVSWLADRTIDNTMAGIRARMAEFDEYKSVQRAGKVTERLDVIAHFENLALRLKNNNRPAFAPEQPPAVIDEKFGSLDNAEKDKQIALMAELERQLKLERLGGRFRGNDEKLTAWVAEKDAYLANKETIEDVETAEFHLDNLKFVDAEIGQAKETRLNDSQAKLLAELESEKYEFTGDLKKLQDAATARFSALESQSASRKSLLEGELKKQQDINHNLCTDFKNSVDALSGHVTAKLGSFKDTDEVEAQLAAVVAVQGGISEAEGLLAKVDAADAAVIQRKITVDPSKYTNVTATDCKSQVGAFRLTLSKKQELLEQQVESKKNAGMTAEQMAEFQKNFEYFDADKSNALIRKELRACLQSLGEESTPAELNKILEKYGVDAKISNENFIKLMIDLAGDTNSKEEILTGFCYLSTNDEAKIIEMFRLENVVNDNTFKDNHVSYLKENMSGGDNDKDFPKWTDEVFAR